METFQVTREDGDKLLERSARALHDRLAVHRGEKSRRTGVRGKHGKAVGIAFHGGMHLRQ